MPIQTFKFLSLQLLAMLLAPLASAATYCVGTVSELQAALSAAATSTADDEIHIRIGAYGATQQLIYNSQNNGWLFLLGGYTTLNGEACGTRLLNASNTILSGGGTHQVLGIYFNPLSPPNDGPRLGVSNLTLSDGMGTGFQRGGGLDIAGYGSAYTEIWLDNLLVTHNTGYFSGGINATVGNGLIRVVNSLFADNAAPTSAFGHLYVGANSTAASHGAIIANNTFVNGTCAGSGGRGCGVGLSACGGVAVQISNNIFSNNAISDLNLENCIIAGLGTGSVAMHSNSGGTLSGNLAPTISHPLSLVPKFEDALIGNFRLRTDSPLINQGIGPIPIYSYNGFDLDGALRVRNGALDVGAFEHQILIFADGFENSSP